VSTIVVVYAICGKAIKSRSEYEVASCGSKGELIAKLYNCTAEAKSRPGKERLFNEQKALPLRNAFGFSGSNSLSLTDISKSSRCANVVMIFA